MGSKHSKGVESGESLRAKPRERVSLQSRQWRRTWRRDEKEHASSRVVHNNQPRDGVRAVPTSQLNR
jgi:hypothetical protein